MIVKIISGGQTGADQGGLAAGKELGLATGGWAPVGWLTENGPQEELLKSYGLQEWSRPGYAARTAANVTHSDKTVWFGLTGSPGYCCTVKACHWYHRPVLINPAPDEFLRWIKLHPASILNVAGNRERLNPGIYERTKLFLTATLTIL